MWKPHMPAILSYGITNLTNSPIILDRPSYHYRIINAAARFILKCYSFFQWQFSQMEVPFQDKLQSVAFKKILGLNFIQFVIWKGWINITYIFGLSILIGLNILMYINWTENVSSSIYRKWSHKEHYQQPSKSICWSSDIWQKTLGKYVNRTHINSCHHGGHIFKEKSDDRRSLFYSEKFFFS